MTIFQNHYMYEYTIVVMHFFPSETIVQHQSIKCFHNFLNKMSMIQTIKKNNSIFQMFEMGDMKLSIKIEFNLIFEEFME